jgi:hypothetical protein
MVLMRLWGNPLEKAEGTSCLSNDQAPVLSAIDTFDTRLLAQTLIHLVHRRFIADSLLPVTLPVKRGG